MKNYNANQALPIILKVAKEYDEKLKDKQYQLKYYDECTYLSKGCEIKKFPEEIIKQLNEKLL